MTGGIECKKILKNTFTSIEMEAFERNSRVSSLASSLLRLYFVNYKLNDIELDLPDDRSRQSSSEAVDFFVSG